MLYIMLLYIACFLPALSQPNRQKLYINTFPILILILILIHSRYESETRIPHFKGLFVVSAAR